MLDKVKIKFANLQGLKKYIYTLLCTYVVILPILVK